MGLKIKRADACKFDLVSLGECMIRLSPPAHGRIEFAPAHFGNSEIAREPIDRRAFRPITNQHRAVGEFHDWPHKVIAGHLRHELDSREAGQIREIVLVAQSEAARRGTHARPKVGRIVFVGSGARHQNFFSRGSDELELETRIRQRCRDVDRMLAAGRSLLPFFLQE